MEQNFNENPHPCVGVMYPAFLNDTPAEWRDLPPDGLTLEETESMVVLRTVDDYEFGVIYPAVLDELDPLDDGEVEIVDEPFDMSKVICST